MPEPAEEVYARVVAAVGRDGRLPISPAGSRDDSAWEAVDRQLVPRVLRAPADEAVRAGEDPQHPCGPCEQGFDPDLVVWEDRDWVLTHAGAPSGLPLVLLLHTREHLDFGELDDTLASEYGRIANRLVRIIEHLPEVGRVHTSRWGDASAHFHVWFFARTARLTGVTGPSAAEWDDLLPPGAEDIWRADLGAVAQRLANWGGTARA